MVDYAGLSGRGALLLVAEPAGTKNGLGELVGEIDQLLSSYESLNGSATLLPYQKESLKFLKKKLRERKEQLNRRTPEEDV